MRNDATQRAADRSATALTPRNCADEVSNQTRLTSAEKKLQALQRSANGQPSPAKDLATKLNPPIQREEVDDLTPGRLNMIGEKHDVYSGNPGRYEESRKIKSELGEGTAYRTESLLKLDAENVDYADPIALRLEQIISLIKHDYDDVLAQHRALDLTKMDTQWEAKMAKHRDTAEAEEDDADPILEEDAVLEDVDAVEVDHAALATAAATALAPHVFTADYDKEAVIERVKALHLAQDTVYELATAAVWNRDKHDPTDTYFDQLYDLLDAIDAYGETIGQEDAGAERDAQAAELMTILAGEFAKPDFDIQQLMLRLDEGADPDLLAILADPANWDLDALDTEGRIATNLERARPLFERGAQGLPQETAANMMLKFVMSANHLYKSSKNRLPGAMKLYLNLRNSPGGEDATKAYRYDVDHIPSVLYRWNKLQDMSDAIAAFQHDFATPPRVLMTRILKDLGLFMRVLGEGVDNLDDTRDPEDIQKLRSIEMNNAANALYNQPIAWKVGDRHVTDIRNLEAEGRITTDYAYISKENFNTKYLTDEMLKYGTAFRTDMDEGYHEEKANVRKTLEDADVLLGRMPNWEMMLDHVEHLHLPNVVFLPTRAILRHVEQGRMPNLRTVTLSRVGLSLEVKGQLEQHNIEVVVV